MVPFPTFNRRDFLRATAAVAATGSLGRAADSRRLKVAAVFTEFTYRSHAHVILENFLQPYYFNGQVTDPGCDVVSFYADQLPPGRDMARDVAKVYKIPLFSTIAEALCLGGKDLAVNAVLSIGEHGSYPTNAKGQREFPRKRFFDEITAVMRRAGRVVPVFTDKHLSYRWDWAKAMYDTARELKVPFMAGSSVPLAQRVPPLEIPNGAKITDAIATHGGILDSYDFHAYEVLQSMVEGRAGGETGVASVQYLATAALRRAAEAGQWSPDLLQAAWDLQKSHPSPGFAGEGPGGRGSSNPPSPPTPLPPSRERGENLDQFWKADPWGLLVQYRDGLRGLVLRVSGDGTRWNFACRVAGEPKPLATSFYVGPWRNRCLFKALAHAIQAHFREGKSPYPVERTLLTTGLTEAGVESHANGDRPYETPHLDFKYAPTDFRAMREMGASWKVVTEATPEPTAIDRLGRGVPPSAPPGTEGGFNPVRKR
jgi:hypothetical protein